MKGFRLIHAVALVGGLLFLYVPIGILILYSFNASRLVTVWGGFSTHWYGALLSNEALLSAAWLSLRLAFVSATLLPLGSEPAVFGLIKLNPHLFWPAILVATAGNTLGGVVTWWMGYGAHQMVDKYRDSPTHLRALGWLRRIGPPACFLSFLPIIGDPLTLEREPDNRHDRRAVKVLWRGIMIGYLPRAANFEAADEMDAGARLSARIGRLAPDPDPWKRLRVDVWVELAR